VEASRPALGDFSRGNLDRGTPWEQKVFPVDQDDWAVGLFDPSRTPFENFKAIQGAETGQVRQRLISQNRNAFVTISQNLAESASPLQNPKDFDRLISLALLRQDPSGAFELSIPRSRRMYHGGMPDPWDSDGVSYVITLAPRPHAMGARVLQGRYVVPEVGSDFVDPSFFPKVTDNVNTIFSELLAADRLADGYSAAGAHLDMMESLAPHLARNADNVLYYTQFPEGSMGMLSAGTLVNGIDEAFEVAARRGRAYITDPHTGSKIRVPDEIANRYRGDLGPVAKDLSSDFDFISNTRSSFDDFHAAASGSRGTGDQVLEEIYRVQGFNAPPRIVSVDELEQLHRAGYTPIYRGITDVLPNTPGGQQIFPDGAPQKSLHWANQLLYGPTHYAAPGSVGAGTYFTPAFARGSNYTEGSGVIVAGAIHPGARIMGPGEYHNIQSRIASIGRTLNDQFARYDEIERMRQGSLASDVWVPEARSFDETYKIAMEALESAGLANDPIAPLAIATFRPMSEYGSGALVFSDPGRIAATLGFDGYLAPSTLYGYSKPEYVMLNRGAMILADVGIEVSGQGRNYTPRLLSQFSAPPPPPPPPAPLPPGGLIG
jgi:hypothetical protein